VITHNHFMVNICECEKASIIFLKEMMCHYSSNPFVATVKESVKSLFGLSQLGVLLALLHPTARPAPMRSSMVLFLRLLFYIE
jgi:hypothetical protein